MQHGMYNSNMMIGQNIQDQIQDYGSGMDPNSIKYDQHIQNAYIHKQNLDIMSTLITLIILNIIM